MIWRWLVMISFLLSVAAPAGVQSGGRAHQAAMSHHTHQDHGGVSHHPGPATEGGASGCGDCGQPVFCCAHVSIAAPDFISGQGLLLGGYIIIPSSQDMASSASAGRLFHPPKA